MKKAMKTALCGAGLVLSLAGGSAWAAATVQIAAAEGSQGPSGEMRIEREVEAACREIDEGQAALSDRCSLADYRALVRAVNGTNMWTAALQKALDEHEIVTIPASDEKYFFDGTVVVPSRRRIEAKGATIRLADGMRTVLLRNASAQDGTLAPIPSSAKRDTDIAIVGGRWEDCCTRRAGYGRTGMFNLLPRRKGNYFGVSTLFFFNNVNRLSVTGATFHHTGGFAVQAGDGDAVAFRDISFDRCLADGLHLNGNLTRVLARNVRGQVGDDLVALNAYDWLNSSVNFGPQRYILCEDLELVRLPGVSAYPAIRIQPAKYRYADGSIVDCAISDVIFRRVKGITTYKMYLQTPRYTIGSTPEWAEVGSGGNLFFSDLEIDLDAPIDKIGQYATQEAPRGHFAAFEFGANLSLVHFENIDITFHADKWPLAHLVQVGPKSCFYPGKDGKPGTEIFDPYVSCRVERVVLENVRVQGTPPAELVYSAAFDDINKDGRSSGRGVIEKIVEERGTGDVARVKGTDGVWREVPLVGVREADGGVRYTFPAAEARKAQVVQFWLDRAQAKTGEEGFWMGGRGVVGYFTREKMHWGNGAQFMDHPYFAMQTPRGAFIAIVEGMRFEFDAIVEAKNGRYRAYPSWNIERHAFGEVYEDLSLVVYDLGKGADWNAMAKAYRRRVLAREGATRRIETLKERAKARPHLLKMANAIALRRRHACKPYIFKDPKHDVDFTPETEKKPECLYSFAQTLAFLQRLKALGVDDVALCVAGWQDGGYDGRCPSSFPVSPEAGGEAELRKLIRGGQALGYIVDGHSNYTDCYAVSPMWDGGRVACKFPDGSIQRCHDAFAGGRAYRLCLKNAWETFLPGELEKIAALGFRGAHYIDVFTAVYPYACCDPRHRANRKEIAAYQRQVVERCIALFGGFSSECDMDHLIGLVDYVNYNTREIKNARNARAKGRNLPFDRIVPFSELAFHDYLLANPDKSTQEFPSEQNWLDLVEFGGRPIVYNFTDDDAEKIRDLYLKFKPLRHLQLEEMVEHCDVAPGVVRVTYGDGSRVYVNHTDALVEADGVRVPARDYLLLRAAVDAPIGVPQGANYLDEMDLADATCGARRTPRPRHTVEGGPISLAGKVFDRGLGVHAPFEFKFFANGAATRFTANVGVDDDMKDRSRASVRFLVFADDRVAADSGVLRAGARAALDADLTGAKWVTLKVTDAGDGYACDHADWADAAFVFKPGAKWGNALLSRQLGILTPPESPAPRINGPTVFGVRPGHPILYWLPVTGERPMKLAVEGLPEGATFDAASGLLGGAVSKPGDYALAFAAENARGKVKKNFTLKVGSTICLTPPLGWNSWNCWGQDVTDEKMRRAADAMVASGLADHGWSYIVVDDCWRTRPTEKEAGMKRPGWIGERAYMYGPARTADDLPCTNPTFPDMRAMIAYIHAKGLKAGLYSVPATVACCWTWGSFGHEAKDAEVWADWGVDLLKYDWCTADRDWAPTGDNRTRQFKAYKLMGDLLAQQKRDIVYNVCNYGRFGVTEWARAAGGQYWRTNDDLKDTWPLLIRSINENMNVADAAGPGGWNDPDMLVVGPMRSNGFTTSRLTPNEQYAHMSLWAIMAAPLFIGCDLERLDPLACSLLTNDEVLDIDQDALGNAGRPVVHTPEYDVWLRPLADGSWAVALFNRTWEEREIAADFKALGLPASCAVRDVWAQKDLGVFTGRFAASIPGHAALLYRCRFSR